MNTSEINRLLEKYYDGESTLQEEKTLREFFAGEDIPEQLRIHRELFAHYGREQEVSVVDPAFENRITASLEQAQEQVQVVSMTPPRNRFMFMAGIAAGVLLLIGLFATIRYEVSNGPTVTAVRTDPESAYRDVNEALMLVSGNLNNGLKQVERLQMVDKAMKNMQLFNKFYQYQTIIINPDDLMKTSIKSK
jgi:hypothetical protein